MNAKPLMTGKRTSLFDPSQACFWIRDVSNVFTTSAGIHSLQHTAEILQTPNANRLRTMCDGSSSKLWNASNCMYGYLWTGLVSSDCRGNTSINSVAALARTHTAVCNLEWPRVVHTTSACIAFNTLLYLVFVKIRQYAWRQRETPVRWACMNANIHQILNAVLLCALQHIISRLTPRSEAHFADPIQWSLWSHGSGSSQYLTLNAVYLISVINHSHIGHYSLAIDTRNIPFVKEVVDLGVTVDKKFKVLFSRRHYLL